ncbi:Stage II sporulation protein E (SpoIIE) [Actinacidiphila yanglinensis]|uniref:Stage II sporulation protein E (SpoIIE) n=2 Tax=Actinacidiphila yanglinensis TaxID=310779 RepID=A0A1H6BA51_9ACTN|nr:Stage II sporulation protein E (SpoIIE) [Actinacidiphila yanglinensis]
MALSARLSARSPVLWTAVLTVLVMVIGPTLNRAPEFAGFLVFLPAAAAGVCTVKQTAWISAWTAFVTVCAIVIGPSPGLGGSVALIMVAIGFGAFAVYLCHWRLKHVAAAVRLQKAADAMQRHLLRPLPVHAGQATLAGVHAALGDDVLIGGDIYDMVESAHGVRVMVADVQGKGLGALGSAVAAVAAFRDAVHAHDSLVAVSDAMEKAVDLQNSYFAQTGEPERFVTAVILGVRQDGEITMVNCGHPAPYLLDASGVRQATSEPADVPLGLGGLAGPRTATRFSMDAHQTLVLFSDGLNEARDRDGEFFPLRERLSTLLNVPGDEVAARLWRQLQEFTGDRQQDDTTVLTLRTEGAAPSDGTNRP